MIPKARLKKVDSTHTVNVGLIQVGRGSEQDCLKLIDELNDNDVKRELLRGVMK